MAEDRMTWRNSFSDDSTRPWILLTIDEKHFWIKSNFVPDCVTLYVFDGIDIWSETSMVEDIKSKTKLFNPNVEAPVSKVLQHLKECLQYKWYSSTRGQFNFQYKDPGEQLVLQVTSQLTGGVPFKWKFEATRMDKEVLSEEVTMPLLSMVNELIQREKALVSILKRKDAEIEDMKAGGGKVSRKYLVTAPFNHKEFQQERIQSKSFEETVGGQGKGCFEDDGQALYKEVRLTTLWLNRPRQENLVGDMDTLPTNDDGRNQSPTRGGSVGPSPAGSRNASPRKPFSPGKEEEKQTELLRREALERKLEEEKQKQQQKPKKKKKKLF